MLGSPSVPNSNFHSHATSAAAVQVNAGSICWLPAAEACTENAHSGFIDPDLDAGCFNHPVLVLRKSRKQDTALVLIVRKHHLLIR